MTTALEIMVEESDLAWIERAILLATRDKMKTVWTVGEYRVRAAPDDEVMGVTSIDSFAVDVNGETIPGTMHGRRITIANDIDGIIASRMAEWLNWSGMR